MLKKKLWIGLITVVLAVLVLAVVFGASFVASHYYKKGARAYSQNNFSVAKNNLTTSLIFDSKNYRAHFLLGKIALGLPAPKTDNYYPQADYKEAVSHYEKAVSLGLEQKNKNLYGVALDDLGGAYWKLNELGKAREKYSEKLSKFPNSSFWARYFIAFDDYNRLNKPEEALQTLFPALNLAKSDNDRWNLFQFQALLAFLYGYYKDYDNSQKYAQLAIEGGNPKSKNWIQVTHTLLAVNYGRQKNFSLAENEIKKANDLAGRADAYNCFLASAYAIGENYSKAISVALKIKGDDNNDALCLRTLAVSYLAQGDKIKTKKYMQEYLSFTENFPQKNIFVMRNRERFEGELLKLR